MKSFAPGSVFISGEYLVLNGEPALVSAVNRYVSAEIVGGVGYEVEGLPESVDLSLPHAVCDVLEIPKNTIDGVTSSVLGFGDGGKKYGLSSSAASCVALTKTLSPESDREEILKIAGLAHRKFQNGKGSNADVQLAVMGGTSIVYAQDFSKELVLPQSVTFPANLKCEVVWMEASAKTVSFISKFEEMREKNECVSLYEAMRENNRIVLDAFRGGRIDDFLDALSLQDDLLEKLGDLMEAPVCVEAHKELRKVCGDELVAKVSGSGGGDISLVFGPKDADWAGFHARLPDSLCLLEMSVDAPIVE